MSAVARPASFAPEIAASRFWFAAPRCWARERWARALPRTWPMRGFLCCCWTWCRRARARGTGWPWRRLGALAKAKPAAFYEPSLAALITPGNFEDDLPKLAQCDWVVEAVAENLEIKTALLNRVAPHLNARAVLTTNTSGLPVGKIAAGLDGAAEGLRKRFFGTHFFNPPRYMRLLEVIPTAESDAGAVAAFAAFADRMLGKQVVFANDTPNFIANRIGVAVMFNAATLMLEQGLTIEEVDALTGPAIGWPRTGTFRLADMVGIDILAHVAANFPQGVTAGGFSGVLERDCEARLAGG